MKTELLEPIEEEREIITEEMYDDILNEGGEVEVCGITFDRSDVLKELDPTAYRRGLSDMQEYETIYKCPICQGECDDYDEAMYCCQTMEEEEEEEETGEGETEL